MAQSLSPLQKDILAALEEFPALEEVMHTGDLLQWARPSQIISADATFALSAVSSAMATRRSRSRFDGEYSMARPSVTTVTLSCDSEDAAYCCATSDRTRTPWKRQLDGP